jgi:predicted N-acyltransferase
MPLSLEWYEGDSLSADFSGQPLFKILTDLYNQTVQKHIQRPSPLNEDYLLQLWKMDRQNLRLCLASLDGKIVAFSMLRVYGSAAHAFMVGRDYHCSNKIPSYFSVVYTEPIILGIHEGWDGIYYRPISYRAKLRRGCKLEKLYLYVKGHSLLLQKFIDAYITMSWKHFNNKYIPPKLYTY